MGQDIGAEEAGWKRLNLREGIFGIMEKSEGYFWYFEKKLKASWKMSEAYFLYNEQIWRVFLYLEKKLKVYLEFGIFIKSTLVFNHDLLGVSGHGLVG